jgi:hypothetical protein
MERSKLGQRVFIGAALGALVSLAGATELAAVPAFARQTGLSCNQCHPSTMIAPGFTYTGKLFRMRGYRTPNLGERMQVNPGKWGGLDVSINDYFSWFFRLMPYSQTKAPGGTTAMKSYPLYLTQSIFYVGPVTPYAGVWLEIYFQNAQPGRGETIEQSFANVNELEFVVAKDFGDNILAFQLTNRGGADGTGPFWWPFLGQRLWDHDIGVGPSPGQLGFYGYFNRLVYGYFGVSPGGDNRNWDNGMNYFANLALSPLREDINELWLNVEYNAGNDQVPLVNARQRNTGTDNAYFYSFGIPVAGIGPKDTERYSRVHSEIRYNTVDRGPHTLETAAMFSNSKDTYTDGSKASIDQWGLWARYMYQRKAGIALGYYNRSNYEYTDPAGAVTSIDIKPTWDIYLWLQPAMNLQPGIAYRPTYGHSLTGPAQKGYAFWVFANVLY